MRDEGIGLAGWLLADVVLALAVIFLAMAPSDPSASAPVWTDTHLGDPVRDQVYGEGIRAEGVPTPRYELIDGGLPSGLSLDTTTGQISGVPTQEGPFTFLARAVNGQGSGAVQQFDGIVRLPMSECVADASFLFDQIVIPEVRAERSATGQLTVMWDTIEDGRVRTGLTKDQENTPVTDLEFQRLPQSAGEFLAARYEAKFQLALVETYEGSPVVRTDTARAINETLARELHGRFMGTGDDRPPLLLRARTDPTEWWAGHYFMTSLPAGSARINLYFVKALPPECSR